MNDHRNRAASSCLVARNKTQYLRYVSFQCLNSSLILGVVSFCWKRQSVSQKIVNHLASSLLCGDRRIRVNICCIVQFTGRLSAKQ